MIFGVDILAEKDGVTYAIQCKRYADPVGVKKQCRKRLRAGEYYDRMVGAVLTNQYFTAPAVAASQKAEDPSLGQRLSGQYDRGRQR